MNAKNIFKNAVSFTIISGISKNPGKLWTAKDKWKF